ncbi:MAG: hypothetical protein LiPW16_221 [Microgenomates group bacterium LiPW_16]|nr:MAG: hypothetical protein LiPW16_221 [Microgenomates group bacterium LiPW_16]
MVVPAEIVKQRVDFYSHITSSECDPQGITYEICRPKNIDALIESLILSIENSGETFDIIVCPLRGGKIPSERVAEKLKLPIEEIGVSHYTSVEQAKEVVTIEKHFPEGIDFTNRRILIVDDVNHSSLTLEAVIKEIERVGGERKNTKIATLHKKPARRLESDFCPRETTNWVVYPWEIESGEFFRDKVVDWKIFWGIPLEEAITRAIPKFKLMRFTPQEFAITKTSDFLETCQEEYEKRRRNGEVNAGKP